LKQVAAGAALLGLTYALLAVVALLGGPRPDFLPLPGGGPQPAAPVAGLSPGRSGGQSIPNLPDSPSATPTPGVPSTPSTELPPATTTEGYVPPNWQVTTTPSSLTPTPQLVEQTQQPPVAPVTELPPVPPTSLPPVDPTVPTSTHPTQPTSQPTSRPTSTPTTTPSDPGNPSHHDGLKGVLGKLLDGLGL
jgi:hypothetical protein